MQELGLKNPNHSLNDYGIQARTGYWNSLPEELVEHSIQKNFGVLSDSGALAIHTGAFTGRSPKDRFIVKDDYTQKNIDWNTINIPIEQKYYHSLKRKIQSYFKDSECYVKDAIACADAAYRFPLRLIAEYPWSAHFAHNMFLRPTKDEIRDFHPQWTILCAPGFKADPKVDGTRKENFAIINFSEKTILIGGTGYTGEIKKGIFSVLNFLLPHEKNVLAMHCSANTNDAGETAVFFGLSGTGKTTLSADTDRHLIGDDEHGWSQNGVFNFEGGCYAKTIDLTEKKEPEIFRAIKYGALLENIGFFDQTRTPDYTDDSITQNTRVSYPIHYIPNSLEPSIGGHPNNIFFLTCDAFGVFPPISKLNAGQAMYHFISGYTAKIAGTEEGIDDPVMTFSACFGSPFLPLHPTKYAEMLGEKMRQHSVNIWLINTGWTGGPFGKGTRIKLKYTRAMIHAAMENQLENVDFEPHDIFGVFVPKSCPNVPTEILNPRNTWDDPHFYDEKANFLANAFVRNFEQFEDAANEEILNAAPKVAI